MKFRAVILLLYLSSISAVAAAAVSVGPPPSVMRTVDGVVAATNADDAARVGSYFAARSIVVDEFPPYVWNGAGAGASWWRAVHALVVQSRATRLHVVAGRITSWNVSGGTKAYVVVPLLLAHTVNGKAMRESGLWALTMQRLGAAWVITSATWSTQTPN